MKKEVLIGLVVIALIVVVIFIWPSFSAETGTLRLQITDAPSNLNIEQALVTLSNIEVHKADGDNESVNDTNATSGWFVVVQGPVTYDLISITDVRQFLGSKELETGRYTQVRLNLESARVMINGTEYNLTVPSDKLKLVHQFTINANETTTLTLDFDANESVMQTGNNNYILKPTIRILQG